MKIELDAPPPEKNTIEAYSSEGIVINERLYPDSLIVSADWIIEDWPPRTPADLAPHHFSRLLGLSPEIILIGTGRQLRFPDPEIPELIRSRQIWVELMETGAACRAYNFIAAEGRIVYAALLKVGN